MYTVNMGRLVLDARKVLAGQAVIRSGWAAFRKRPLLPVCSAAAQHARPNSLDIIFSTVHSEPAGIPGRQIDTA